MTKTRFQTRMRCLVLICFVFAALPVTAQDLGQQIDELMLQLVDHGQFNGTILVAKDGKEVYRGAFGYADMESGEELQINSAFYLASVSKQFTTMAVMILAEQGKLSYDDPLSKYFPDFPYADRVTIRHMMTHTSGIPDHYRFDIYKPGLNNQIVYDTLLDKPLDFEPGQQYRYSNGGYVLLSMIVAKVANQPFHVFMKEHIFGPLGMENTLVYDESGPHVNRRVVGYDAFGGKDDYTIFTTGAGGLYSTVEDLFKWDQALYTEKLVKKSTLKEAFTPFTLNNGSKSSYGFGWGIMDDERGKTVQHSGGLAGFRTYIERHLDNKHTIIILNNTASIYGNDMVSALRHILHDENGRKMLAEMGVTVEAPMVEVDEGVLAAYVGRYELTPTFIMTITQKGTQLYGQAMGQSPFEMYPSSETEFYLKIVDAQITFNRNDDGIVESLTLHQNGQHPTGKKIE